MPSAESQRISIRSYRLVTDRLERRIFKLDRYRLPLPYGLPLRSLLYFAVALAASLVATAVPILGAALGLLPASVRYLAAPALAAFALTQFELDGRAPHLALLGCVRYAISPKYLAGLRPCPPPGAELAPLLELGFLPTGAEGSYAPGRVRGPARLLCRYPATARRRGRRLHLTPADSTRPLVRGSEIEIPAGAELVVE